METDFTQGNLSCQKDFCMIIQLEEKLKIEDGWVRIKSYSRYAITFFFTSNYGFRQNIKKSPTIFNTSKTILPSLIILYYYLDKDSQTNGFEFIIGVVLNNLKGA